MSHHRYAALDDRLGEAGGGALELDGIASRLLDEALGGGDRLLVRALVRPEREVPDQQWGLQSATGGLRHREHLVEGDRGGRGVAEDRHRRGVAREHQIDSGRLGGPPRRHVIGGDHHDRLAAALLLCDLRERDDRHTERSLCYIGFVMSVRSSRREERKEETRAELVDAAARVFALHGFHGASIEQIAREAGYSTGAIYWHFEGKDDLFLAVYEDYAATRVREWTEVRERAEGDLPQRARGYADQWMARLRGDPEFLVLSLEFLVHAWRNPTLREAFGHRAAFGRLALGRILQEQADARGYDLPMPAEQLATVLRELGSGLGLAKLVDPDGVSDELFGDFVGLFFTLVEGRPHVVAHSYGALGAAIAATRRPELVRSLTLIEPPLYLDPDDPEAARVRRLGDEVLKHGMDADPAVLREFLRHAGAPVPDEGPLPEAVAAGVRRAHGGRSPSEARPPLEVLREAGIPCLVASGGHEPAMERICDLVAAALGGRRIVAPGAGHFVAAAPGFADRLEAFLRAAG